MTPAAPTGPIDTGAVDTGPANTGPGDVAAYLAARPADQRAALRDLRALIATLLPDAIECLSYAMPGFRHPSGQMVAGYAGFARHCGLYPHSGTVIPALLPDCAGFKTSKSGILFTPAHPIPAPLVRRILETRLAEIAAAPPRRT